MLLRALWCKIVRFQRFSWSCGSASVVNAFKHFGVNFDEAKVIPIAGTIAPHNCKHCRKVKKLLEIRKCLEDKWRCKCSGCKGIRKLMRSDDCASGTGEKGILQALRYFGEEQFTASEYHSEKRDAAWQWLHGTLLHGRVVVLCFDSWHHWTLAFGTSGDRVNVFDPGHAKINVSENGLHSLKKDDLMRRWWNARHWVGKQKRLYAISMGKK